MHHPGSQPEMVAEVVRAVLATMSGDLSAQETSLLTEVEALGRTIASAKAEIAALRVDDITDNHIPFATDELDAIVEHTATATNAILNSCETLDDVGSSLTGEPATRLQDATTRIYEACSFQDITGQRINKVVATLKTIEAKVAQIVATFGGGDREAPIEMTAEACRGRRCSTARSIPPSRWASPTSTSCWPASNETARSGLAACGFAGALCRSRQPFADSRPPVPVRVGNHEGYSRVAFNFAVANRLPCDPGGAARRRPVRRRRDDRRGERRAAQCAHRHRRRRPGGNRRGAGNGRARLAARQCRGDRRHGPRRGRR